MKDRMRAGRIALGFGVHHLRTAATAAIAAAAGHHWLFIDCELGAFSIAEASQLCLAAAGSGITPVVRVRLEALDEAARAIDNGALGIIVPHVDTPGQAAEIVRQLRYPPRGGRSWNPAAAQLHAGNGRSGRIATRSALDDEILVIAMIESQAGVAAAPQISAVDGIDGLLVGALDLSLDLESDGPFESTAFAPAIARVAEACRSAGRFLGIGGISSPADLARCSDLSIAFAITGNDHAYLVSGAMRRREAFEALTTREH